MLNDKYEKLYHINSLLSSLTNDEHSQLWEFIVKQTEDLNKKIPEDQRGNANLFKANLDLMDYKT
jgi:hypothetical protein